MLTDFEKHIYNTYLKISRVQNDKPYKLRINFDNFNAEDANSLNKISRLLIKFKNINLVEFIQAPYTIYNDKEFNLKFYTSQKALKSYTLFQDKLKLTNPDSILQKLKDSLIYIRDFCNEQNINIDEYINHKTNNISSYLLHLKEHKVTIHNLFELKNFQQSMKQQDKQVLAFMFGERFEYDNNTSYVMYLKSTQAKQLIRAGNELIKEKSKI